LILADVVRQHAEIAADLYALRPRLVAAPSLGLFELRRLDDRIEAHLDGLAVVGEQAWSFFEQALDAAPAGALFTAGVQALKAVEPSSLDRLFALAEGDSVKGEGLIAAFGWLEPKHLQGKVVTLLDAPGSFNRLVGIAACAVHRVDPGLLAARRILDESPPVRARALRTAGEIGCEEVAPACAAAFHDEDPECRFWAAWSAVLLGDRRAALDLLTATSLEGGAHRQRAFRLVLQTMSPAAAHSFLEKLAADPSQLRWLIQGSGVAGDPAYASWLIGHMANEKTARLAGAAFSLITGADPARLDLERRRPENFESGPDDDPEHPNVEMDADDGLPWPDPQRIEKWWAANSGRFQKGTRHFMGARVSRDHCIDVLKNGYQRQRILAAHYLCLLEPGTPLFNTSAPAWRQQRLLGTMT
jgi:uncharacterized protein (TIGR02270 family)